MENQDIRARSKLRDIKRLRAIIGMMEDGEIEATPQQIAVRKTNLKEMMAKYQKEYVR
ncbi:hypothetical protein [Anaerococcus vaginimassiliensis]|uniref:hypothetical protein n=1 Tax=Anaerococcus vaginimassiliensis TaxID=2042308 RepID=UPI0013EF31C6|nr:hypothetical protein [Anaerococcus vaginimassiliensis]